jgi:MFS superfamily sulfate permease-like transporter
MEGNRTAATPGRGTLWADFLASLVVFMVALPLCIGIAQASGMPPEAGLITGIIGGILVGAISGSPLQVSGPAAGLIVLVLQFFEEAARAGYEGTAMFALFALVVLLSGAVQVIAGLLRMGQWFRAVSPAVVGGMLAGIGITIIAKEFHVLVDDTPPKGVIQGLITIPDAVWKGIVPPEGVPASHQQAAIIGLMTILILVFWKGIAPKQIKFIPAAVVAVILAVAVSEALRFTIDRVPISDDLLGAVVPVSWPGWEVFATALLWKWVVTFAAIASAETLLCATAVDTMHSGPRTKYDKELVAQGVGNMACGALGALPMTGVIVRSSANVDAGAKTRMSTIMHGAWLLLFVVLLPGLLSLIPRSSLAAVLVYTGWKLVNVRGLANLWKESKSEAVIYAATAAAIVSTDLLTGVIFGILLAAAKLLWVSSRLTIDRVEEPDEERVHLHLDGAATFLRLPKLAAALETVPPGRKVHVHIDGLRFIDHAVLHLLMTFQKQYEVTGGRVYIDWERLHAHFRAEVKQVAKSEVSLEPGQFDQVPEAVARGYVSRKHRNEAPDAQGTG